MPIAFWILFFSVIVSLTISLIVGVTGTRYSEVDDDDRVKNLPGQPPVNFNHYAGYIKLREEEEKALFYWFFEAENASWDKPLVLWLSGGPGCSSIAFGAAQEIGPFLVGDNQRLKFNKFSWNQVANIIFLESPIGVGYSYTNNSKDLSEVSDEVVAMDNYAFLVGWFKRFPNYQSHEFYIIGESYGGHYAPQLAEVINEKNKGLPYINLKGIMMGNAVINDDTDTKGIFDYAFSHGIISNEVYSGIRDNCDFKKNKQTRDCSWSVAKFLKAYSNIDIFNIYGPLCLNYTELPSPRKHIVAHFLSNHELWSKLPLSGYNPCGVIDVDKYFNNKDVQRAIHANITNLSYSYSLCSTEIKNWKDPETTVLPVIKKLLGAGLRIWMYSGDADGRVPLLSTRYSLQELKLNIRKELRAWFEGREVGGWVEEYEGGLTFATVRGAGHQVPIFAPQQALSIFSHFLSAQPLPSSPF